MFVMFSFTVTFIEFVAWLVRRSILAPRHISMLSTKVLPLTVQTAQTDVR